MTSIVQMYGQLYSMPALTARTFNLIGPGGSAGVCAELVRQVARMERGQLPPKLVMGNAEARRDFLDVRDAVKAYWSLLRMRPIQPGSIYNVCSGQAHSIAEIAAALKKHAAVPFEISADKTLLRQGEASVIRGDNSKLRRDTAWSPGFPLEQSIVDALNEQRGLWKENTDE
jgi:GDP-4-dehydro-6-deoxy-D-mannose reductase